MSDDKRQAAIAALLEDLGPLRTELATVPTGPIADRAVSVGSALAARSDEARKRERAVELLAESTREFPARFAEFRGWVAELEAAAVLVEQPSASLPTELAGLLAEASALEAACEASSEWEISPARSALRGAASDARRFTSSLGAWRRQAGRHDVLGRAVADVARAIEGLETTLDDLGRSRS